MTTHARRRAPGRRTATVLAVALLATTGGVAAQASAASAAPVPGAGPGATSPLQVGSFAGAQLPMAPAAVDAAQAASLLAAYDPSPRHDAAGAPVLPAPIAVPMPSTLAAQSLPDALAPTHQNKPAPGDAGARAASTLPAGNAPSPVIGVHGRKLDFAAYPADLTEAWHQLSLDAAADAADDPLAEKPKDDYRAFSAAVNARLTSLQFGWDDPRTLTLLDRVYAAQKPSGGYGLEKEWDVFNDGSVNNKDTIYTVTTAGHVGSILLDGYKAGVVPRQRVVEVLDALFTIPVFEAKYEDTSYGPCMAYSNRRADARAKSGCIINVSLGAAVWLNRVISSGAIDGDTKRIATAQALVDKLAPLALRTYRPDLGGWPYQVGTTYLQDMAHNAYTFASASELFGPARFRPGLLKSLAKTTYQRDPNSKGGSFDPVGQMALYAAAPDVPAEHGWALGLYIARLVKRVKEPSMYGQAALSFVAMYRRGDSEPLWRKAAKVELTAADAFGRAVRGGVATSRTVRFTATVRDQKGAPIIGAPVTFTVSPKDIRNQEVWTEYDGKVSLTVPVGSTVTASVPEGFTTRSVVKSQLTVRPAR